MKNIKSLYVLAFIISILRISNVAYADVIDFDFDTPHYIHDTIITPSYYAVFGGLFLILILIDVFFMIRIYKEKNKEEK